MHPELRRLRRLQRLEQVRAIAKQAAAQDAALAESTLHQLDGLAERTRSLADGYDLRGSASDGLALRQLGSFVAGLSGISASTQRDALLARAVADRKQHELAFAERARGAAETRAAGQALVLAKRLAEPALGARREPGAALGTALE